MNITIDEAAAYNEGRAARRSHVAFLNPYDANTPEARAFYDGWYWENFIIWRAKHAAPNPPSMRKTNVPC